MYCVCNTGLDNLSVTYELYDLVPLYFQIILTVVVSPQDDSSSLLKTFHFMFML
jgi:hypothetical protein